MRSNGIRGSDSVKLYGDRLERILVFFEFLAVDFPELIGNVDLTARGLTVPKYLFFRFGMRYVGVA